MREREGGRKNSFLGKLPTNPFGRRDNLSSFCSRRTLWHHGVSQTVTSRMTTFLFFEIEEEREKQGERKTEMGLGKIAFCLGNNRKIFCL